MTPSDSHWIKESWDTIQYLLCVHRIWTSSRKSTAFQSANYPCQANKYT